MATNNSSITGSIIENIAIDHLQQQAVKIIHRNFACKYGEIDIIAVDQNTLAFIEVRFRKHAKFGSAIESVDWHKCQKIILAARFYLTTKVVELPCRFDVIGISHAINAPQIEWIKDAFHAEHEID